MSGRSGYGRSKIVGKLIHLPANMMMAGLAPKVGKPGWAIRLYYARVDECFCKCPPIKIIRRFFSPGNVGDNQLGTGITVNANIAGGASISQSQMYYGIVFDRPIKSPQQVLPTAGDQITLRTPNVNWTTGIDSGGFITDIDLADTDFQVLTGSGSFGGLSTGLILDVGPGVVGTGGGLAQWSEVNSAAAGVLVQNVELENSGAGGGSMGYIITNPAKVGGYALLFNVTRLFLSSCSGPITSSAPAEVDSYTGAQLSTYGLNLFRQNLAIAAGFATTTVVNPTNNISTTFTPGADLTLTADDCTLESAGGTAYNAPVGGFSIAAGNGEPALVLLP